jgi:hypothetical protein
MAERMDPHSRPQWALAVTLLALQACAPRPQPLPPEPPAAHTYSEEALPQVENARVEIIDLQEIPEPEAKRVRVAGTLINFGKSATTQVSVRVRAVDENGGVVAMIYGTPSTQEIPPGGSATFTAWFDDLPQIRRYHVEAVVR